MDINLMVLNVGNTRLAAGAFVAGELMKVVRASLEDPAAVEEAVAAAWAVVGDGSDVAAAGVNPDGEAAVTKLVQKIAGKSPQWVGTDLDIPIVVATDNPQQTGVDRVMNVAAAFEQLGKACVVVDAGTALTVSMCDDSGTFLGGAIAPGVRLMLESLHGGTAKLPQVELAIPEGFVGKDTDSAICQGVYHALRGLVRETVEGFAVGQNRWPEVIATGGDAALLFDGWELVHAVSPDLTLYGIALAYAEHHIRHPD